ncbi:ornithine-acyl-ACP acyltransferase, partial [Mycobacterium tuberculosis]
MKELPNPTFPLSQIGLRAALWPAPATGAST